ncbi:unnamed protein product [Rhizophagus irregularis]|nr:unnamed protein product [Rhizophagus irregularis]
MYLLFLGISSFSLDSDIPIWYPVPSALDFLVGFLDIGRLLALVIFFVGWYLAVDQHLGMNRSWWSQNWTLNLNTKLDFKDSSLDTNQTLR